MNNLALNQVFQPMITVIILSFFLGASTLLNTNKSQSKPPLLLLNLFCFLTCLLTFSLNYLTSFNAILPNSISIIIFVLSVSTVCSIFNVKSNYIDSLLCFFSFLLAGILGFLLGYKLFNLAAILIAGTLVVNSFLYLKKIFYVEKNNQNIIVECLTDTGLENVLKLFKVFKINIVSREIERKDKLKIKLNYKTSAMTQHVLLKQLYSQKDIGKVIA